MNDAAPDRLIDATGVAWYAARHSDRTVYLPGHAYPGHTRADAYTLDQLTDMRGPLRPFGPPGEDSVALWQMVVRRLLQFRQLRPRFVGTIAVALYDTVAQTGPTFPVVQPSPRTSHEDAIAALTHHVGPAVAKTPTRYCSLGREDLTGIFLDWVTDPHRYTDPASNLAVLLASPVKLAGGWTAVTDEPLRSCPQAGLIAWYVRSEFEDDPCSSGSPSSAPPS